jgi:hypothetical protein
VDERRRGSRWSTDGEGGGVGQYHVRGGVRVGRVPARWQDELSLMVLGGVGVAAVLDNDGEGSLQH